MEREQVCRKIDNKAFQVEGEIYWKVDTIAFRFNWTIIRTMRGDISDVKSTMDVRKCKIQKPKGKFVKKSECIPFPKGISTMWNANTHV